MKPFNFELLLRSIGRSHLQDFSDRPLIEMWQARQRAHEKWDYRISLNVPYARFHDFQQGTSVEQMVEHLGLKLDDFCEGRISTINIWRKTLPRKADREQRDNMECLQLRAYMEFVSAVAKFKENPS